MKFKLNGGATFKGIYCLGTGGTFFLRGQLKGDLRYKIWQYNALPARWWLKVLDREHQFSYCISILPSWIASHPHHTISCLWSIWNIKFFIHGNSFHKVLPLGINLGVCFLDIVGRSMYVQWAEEQELVGAVVLVNKTTKKNEVHYASREN